ncbi:MAG: FHA domain-containing protein, partial [Hyphomicrobiales bacterium]|nr:FHA domain-containing protein [Hyphomicrobiales bacterium]
VGLRSGQSVSVTPAGERFGEAPPDEHAVATLVVDEGLDAGKQFPLRAGSNQVGRGRGNDVQLSDPLVSKAHARINVADTIEVIDLGSSNGTTVAGDLAPRATLRADDRIQLGDTAAHVVDLGRTRELSAIATYDFNRSPRLDVVYEGQTVKSPEPPKPFQPRRMPIIPAIAPVLLGCVMFAITQRLVTVLFVALSPIMMLGNVIESRVFGKRDHKKAVEAFEKALERVDGRLGEMALVESEVRLREYPATSDAVLGAQLRSPVLWSYRADARGFLDVRLGLGELPSRTELELPSSPDAAPGLYEQILEVRERRGLVAPVPVVASLPECGSLGFAGPRPLVLSSARAAIAQIGSLHSPADVVVAMIASSGTAEAWDWLKWLPHVASEHSPLAGDHLVSSPGGAQQLIAQLEDVVATRIDEDGDALAMPGIVLLVEDDAPIDRSRLVQLAEAGRQVGVHLIWLAASRAELPAACRTFLDLDPAADGSGGAGYVDGGIYVGQVEVETFCQTDTLDLARALSPVVDAGARVDDDSDLPRSVSMVSLVGQDVAQSPDAVVDRWRTSGSLQSESVGVKRSKDAGLRAMVGSAAGQSMVLDLRAQGPHALVGGTTGAGKSEFLQSWVMGMALEHSPERVTFLFVDYKGGAAFSECVELPHCVGLVTDLSPHLVRRALTSLNAELHHREIVLQKKKAKDLLELERSGDPETPPSLVIVVDEFAALVNEVPEFVDGVVNVAQRGRSLGLHLILATQRPAGVIKDNLRANTNLRVALRMADEADSTDVIGTDQAAGFDPSIPGRGVVKSGPGRLTPFQSGYVGGWTSDKPPPPIIKVEGFVLGSGAEWESPSGPMTSTPPSGPNDLKRLVGNVRGAHGALGLTDPRRPWLDALAPVYDLARTPQSRTDAELVFGVMDVPDHQRQEPVAFHPDTDGNMAVYGTGGAGKSAVLRTLAVAAGLGTKGGPCHVYGLDFGARGLQMLEVLPHVGSIVPGDDSERLQRLLRTLRDTIDERAARFAKVNAGTIEEYRQAAGKPDEARILLLVDNIGTFRTEYEVGPHARYFDVFQGIAADGRQVGVHVVVTADRANAVTAGLNSVIQRRLVLRMASENDLLFLGVSTDSFDSSAPPGRAFLGGNEVQVAVLGGSSNTSRQAAAIDRLAADLAEMDREPAPAVRRLPEQVTLGQLPPLADGLPSIGIADDTLAPVGFVPEDVMLIVGPPQSGRTTLVASVALSLARAKSPELIYLGAGRSPLKSLVPWGRSAASFEGIAELAHTLTAELDSGGPPPAIFLEDVASFASTDADMPLQDLVKAVRTAGGFLVAEAETSTMGSWPLQAAIKASRYGIALQPDQLDGDTMYKVPFGRVARADFPAGRGFMVRSGVARRVQCAVPDMAS